MWLRKPPAQPTLWVPCVREIKMDSVCPNRTKLPKHWHISKHQSVPKNLLVYLFSSHIPLFSTHDREPTTYPAVPSVIKSSLSPRERLSCCSPTSLLELEMGGCSQRGAAGTFKHPDRSWTRIKATNTQYLLIKISILFLTSHIMA